MFEEFNGQKFNVILTDPAWSFLTYSDKGKDRSPEKHYDCMTLNDIKNMPILDLASENCVLLMWVIDPMLPQALDVIKGYGFTYKTVAFTWVKTQKSHQGLEMVEKDFFMGMGYYVRKNPEMVILATRGKPKRKQRNVRQLIISPRREHSRKPDEIFSRIERLFDGPYIELFARERRPNWSCWGNDIDKF